MSGRFGRIHFGNEIANPFLGKPRQPNRHGVFTVTASTVEREPEHPAFDVELGQFPNVSDAFGDTPHLSPHKSNSPRSNPERVWNETLFLNGGNPGFPLPNINIGGFRPTAFSVRRTAEQPPANDNEPMREAEAA